MDLKGKLNQLSIFDEIVLYFRSVMENLPDKRTGKNKRYKMSDAALSAFSVFFTQSPSFLAYQRSMAFNKGKNNAQSLFGVHQVPTDNQSRDLLDEVEPALVFPVFSEIFKVLKQNNHLSRFFSFKNNLLIALDGTEYFCSKTLHCPQCSSRTFKNGTTQYFHAVVTPVIVCPAQPLIIPLIPEFIVLQDGNEKQDCELSAAKRWLLEHGKRYQGEKVTILGDDLYCHQPLCELLLREKFNFILVCRPDSHLTLYEHLEGISLPTVVRKRWTGKVEETYTYRYLNQVPLRNTDDSMLVNWCFPHRH